jgi:hypothetical protein
VTTHRQVRIADDWTAEPARRADRGRLRLARDPHGGPKPGATRAAVTPLDQVLESLERVGLSASEVRILLAVLDREVTVSELAPMLGRPPAEIRLTGERLYARGLLRWRDDARSGETVLGTTGAGVATVRPLLTAVGIPDGRRVVKLVE